MIGQLTGFIGHVGTNRCLVDVQGVGYVVFASTRTLGQLPHPPEIARVLIETIVREDSIQLFGFADPQEQEWFRLLTTVQGVGSRVALGILSVSSPTDLWQAVNSGDKVPFTQANGVGSRLATRLLTELKNKVAKMPVPAGNTVVSSSSLGDNSHNSTLENDALMALEGLGFRRVESWPIINRVVADNPDAALDLVIRLSLRELAQ